MVRVREGFESFCEDSLSLYPDLAVVADGEGDQEAEDDLVGGGEGQVSVLQNMVRKYNL